MYIYSVTVNIDDSVREEWIKWMKEVHIQDVMNTGLFISNKFCKVLVDEESGSTYSIQYIVKDLQTMQLYHEMNAPATPLVCHRLKIMPIASCWLDSTPRYKRQTFRQAVQHC